MPREAEELIHPILKQNHSNALEASNISLRSKNVFLQRLHHHLSTNLACTCTQNLALSTTGFLKCIAARGLPVFEGVQEALERQSAANVRRGPDHSFEKEEGRAQKNESPGWN